MDIEVRGSLEGWASLAHCKLPRAGDESKGGFRGAVVREPAGTMPFAPYLGSSGPPIDCNIKENP